MKQSDIGVIAVIYAIVAAFLSMTLQLPEEAQTYPLTLLGGLLFLNTLYLVLALVKFASDKEIKKDLSGIFAGFVPVQFIFVAVGAVLYVALMEWVGYYAASILYLAASLLFLKVKPSYIVICITALLITIYFVFSMFLKVPLPVGMLFS